LQRKKATRWLFTCSGEIAKAWFSEIAPQYPEMEFRYYEIYKSTENQEKFVKMAEAYGFEAWGVPTIFIGDHHWEGFADSLKPEIEAAIKDCIENSCKDAVPNQMSHRFRVEMALQKIASSRYHFLAKLISTTNPY